MIRNWSARLAAMVISAAMLLPLGGCGLFLIKNDGPQGAKPAIQQTEQTDEIRLTDQAGREIVLEEPAEKLVSCYYITTYATIALGISDRVVGLEKKADTRPIYQLSAPELLEKEQVGSLKEFNAEAVAALAPELVLMPKKLAEHADTLTALGIDVLVVEPETQEGLNGMLELIGRACGVEDKAAALIAYYDRQLALAEKRNEGQDKRSVYMGGNSSYLMTAPAGMYQADLIARAGGENAARDIEGDYWTEVSYETILAMDPDYIIVPCGAAYTADDIRNDARLDGVRAVQNGAVYEMPQGIEEWDSPIPSGILGVMWLESVLHPEQYSFDAFTADVQDFYKTFYGFDMDPALITK